ncbi:MAG: hypothetical protein P9M15_06735 [Candidatus Electryoneaceae bacterium]|nr:hypothetical protein [Candidatus Electryoneaceae bacterium]
MKDRPIEGYITDTLKQLCCDRGLGESSLPIILEIPRNKGFGDLSCNVAMVVAKQLRTSPRELAQTLASSFPTSSDMVESVKIAGPGFLNFHLSPQYFHKLLAEIVSDPGGFGDSDEGADERWHFEFVSANPTDL